MNLAKSTTAHAWAIVITVIAVVAGLGWSLKLMCIDNPTSETQGLILFVVVAMGGLFFLATLYQRLKDLRDQNRPE